MNACMLCCVTRYVLQVGLFDVKRKGSCRRVKDLGKAADGRDFVIKPYVHATILAEDRRHCPSRLAEARNISPSHLSCNYNGRPTPGPCWRGSSHPSKRQINPKPATIPSSWHNTAYHARETHTRNIVKRVAEVSAVVIGPVVKCTV